MLEQWLSKAGYQVCTATCGAEALAKALEGHVQILITDWDMPGEMDGAMLCRRLRTAKLPSYLYILMLTGHTEVKDVVTGLQAGADDYVRKPAHEGEILARVNTGRRIIELERRTMLLSITDPLLGCYNRRFLNEQLLREIAAARRYDTPLSLLMADLDRFKLINDVHGHLVGDEVLQGFVGRAMRSLRRSVDWIARYGGEEFSLILPHTDAEGARVVAEEVRLACVGTPFETSVGALEVTVSLGLAELPRSAHQTTPAMTDLVSRADAALFRSKREGRNRVSSDGDLPLGR